MVSGTEKKDDKGGQGEGSETDGDWRIKGVR